MKVLTVVGARPNFMKVGPIIAAIRAHNQRAAHSASNSPIPFPAIDHVLVHTGQHYDAAMSDSFFSDLDLPAPDVHLGVGAGAANVQTAEIMKKFEVVLLAKRPDVVILVGDVNSTLACAIVTAKTSFDSVGTRPLLAHVEAGLRSFDRSMPEEINRIVTDHVSDMFFVTEESGLQNLRSEGISSQKIHFVGNTMIDSLLAFKDKAEASTILERLELRAQPAEIGQEHAAIPFALLTLHRPSNVDNRNSFLSILSGLGELVARGPIIFPVHPRTRQRINEFGLELEFGISRGKSKTVRSGILMVDPLGYLDFVCLMKHAFLVVTDSGGIQEETTCLGIPCVTVRENTERPVTVNSGTNIIAGTNTDKIRDAIRRQLRRNSHHSMPLQWDGRAATRIVEILIRTHCGRASTSAFSSQPCL